MGDKEACWEARKNVPCGQEALPFSPMQRSRRCGSPRAPIAPPRHLVIVPVHHGQAPLGVAGQKLDLGFATPGVNAARQVVPVHLLRGEPVEVSSASVMTLGGMHSGYQRSFQLAEIRDPRSHMIDDFYK